MVVRLIEILVIIIIKISDYYLIIELVGIDF